MTRKLYNTPDDYYRDRRSAMRAFLVLIAAVICVTTVLLASGGAL